MPKYGDIIKQAKSVKPDDQMSGFTEDQITSQPDDQTSRRQRVAQIQDPENQVSVKPDSQMTSQPEEVMKNLCVKVPESWRRHWSGQAKLTGRTMTDVIVAALTEEFGLPENQ